MMIGGASSLDRLRQLAPTGIQDQPQIETDPTPMSEVLSEFTVADDMQQGIGHTGKTPTQLLLDGFTVNGIDTMKDLEEHLQAEH